MLSLLQKSVNSKIKLNPSEYKQIYLITVSLSSILEFFFLMHYNFNLFRKLELQELHNGPMSQMNLIITRPVEGSNSPY